MREPGGGATDLRLSNNSDPLNVDSLKTRIMVAGGGGGGCEYYFIGHGGSAGGLKAYLGGAMPRELLHPK